MGYIDSREALAKRWVKMEDTGRVDDEGKAVCERLGLMKDFFGNIHRQIYKHVYRFPFSARGGGVGLVGAESLCNQCFSFLLLGLAIVRYRYPARE